VSTSFPKAGSKNVKVESFVDLCVAVWETTGDTGDGEWVMDILWWATRLTFNSTRVLRHMTRVLHTIGDDRLARRTLGLYVQVAGKAWETHKISKSQAQQGSGEEIDSDREWIETLVSGIRMLCRSGEALPAPDDIEVLREAGKLVGKARQRLPPVPEGDSDGDGESKRLSAMVDLAEGVWNVVMGLKRLLFFLPSHSRS
jgi:hypothetical protein